MYSLQYFSFLIWYIYARSFCTSQKIPKWPWRICRSHGMSNLQITNSLKDNMQMTTNIFLWYDDLQRNPWSKAVSPIGGVESQEYFLLRLLPGYHGQKLQKQNLSKSILYCLLSLQLQTVEFNIFNTFAFVVSSMLTCLNAKVATQIFPRRCRGRSSGILLVGIYHESWNFPAGVSFALKQNMYWDGFCAFCLIYQAWGGGRGGVSCFYSFGEPLTHGLTQCLHV